MEDARTLRDLITPHAWGATLDLTHAYLHVAVHERFSPFLGFYFEGNYYAHRTLCFGLSSSPILFTKLLRPILARIRTFCTAMFYLDDLVVLANSEAEAKAAVIRVVLMFRSLGLTINFSKSHLLPSQTFN
jgi:hypothetical protein